MSSNLADRKLISRILGRTIEAQRAKCRAFIFQDVLEDTATPAGQPILIRNPEDEDQLIVVNAWPSVNMAPECILLSEELFKGLRATEGTVVRAIPIPSPGFPVRTAVQVAASFLGRKEGAGRTEWLQLLVKERLVELRYLWTGLRATITVDGKPQEVLVKACTEGGDPQDVSTLVGRFSLHHTIWIVNWDTRITLLFESVPLIPEHDPIRTREDPYATVGGLTKQITLIRDLIETPLLRPDLYTHFNLTPPRGILLHGPPGTGKTHLARAIAASTGSAVLVINGPELSSAYHGESEAKLREVFDRAKELAPSILVLDEVDAICPRRDGGGGGEVERRVVATLLTLLDGMGSDGSEGRFVVVATTNRPNSIDGALRRPGRFDREIEIGIPDATARFDILNVLLRKTPHSLTMEELQSIASQTHGFVGADLAALVREAGTKTIKRIVFSSPQPYGTFVLPPSLPRMATSDPTIIQTITYADFLASLAHIHPSALRSVLLENPQVRWSDIGGQRQVRQKLREVVEWPLQHPEAFARLGVRPPKGVLLYGPPGCSKTLIAKALATESGINFIAVRGPELLNMFVGESERAVREIFTKARAGAPCIVFFDEVDALGTSRGNYGQTGAHEGVLTSLLNEMDGIQELFGVIVVAATNRPDVMDSALMRPGRLDRILYIGPPDRLGREEIMRIRTAKMEVGRGVDFAELAEMTEGCSGAEITAMCQDAALLAMRENIHAQNVTRVHFLSAAAGVRRQITKEVIARFESWRETSGLTEA